MASSIKNNPAVSLGLSPGPTLTAGILPPSLAGQLSDLASSVGRAVIPIVMQPPQANQESFSKRISQLFDEPPIEFECELEGSSGLTKRVSEAVARNFTNPGNFFDGQIEFGNSAEKSAGHKRKDPFSETGKSSKKEEDSAPSSETRIKHVGLNGFNEKTFDIWRNWRIGKKYEGEVSALDLISLCRGCQFITEERGLFTWALSTLLIHPDLQVGDAQIILTELIPNAEEAEKFINECQLRPSQRRNIIEKFAYAGHLPSQIEVLFPYLNTGFFPPEEMRKKEQGVVTEWLKRAALEKDHTGSQMALVTDWHEPFNIDVALREQLLDQLKKKGEEGDGRVIEFLAFFFQNRQPKDHAYWVEKLSDRHPEDSWRKFKVAKLYAEIPEIKDIEKAKEWFEKGKQPDAESDDIMNTLFSIGKAYEKEGHSQSISSEMAKKEAFACYQKVIEKAEYIEKERGTGEVSALDEYYCKIADCYRKGIGVEQNLDKALEFYKLAKKAFTGCYLSGKEETSEEFEIGYDIHLGMSETYLALAIRTSQEGLSTNGYEANLETRSKSLKLLRQMGEADLPGAKDTLRDIDLKSIQKLTEVIETYYSAYENTSMRLSHVMDMVENRVEALGNTKEYERELQEKYQQVLQKIKGDLEKLQQASPLDEASLLRHQNTLEQLKNLGAQGIDEILDPLQRITGKWEAADQ